jgi:multidrug efflux system membrane fusion protein
MRPVTAGITRDGETVVERGLKAAETVVTDGQLRLVPGAKVNVQAANQPAPEVAGQSTAP